MASPQKENGYTPFAHELLEAILKYPFTLYQFKVLLVIGRKTYGWSKIKAQMSYNEIASIAGISRGSAQKACAQLVAENVLFIQHVVSDRRANIFGIQKDYEQWARWPVPKKPSVQLSADWEKERQK